MMLLQPLRLQVHLVLLLKNRLLLLPDSRVLKFLLSKPLLEKHITLLALRRNSLRMIILHSMMIFCRELNECADSDPATIKKLLAKHSLKNKFTPDPTFATSPICITDPDYDFSVGLSLISTIEADPFYGKENDDAIEHLTKLTELGGLFTTDERIRNFYVTKLLPFSLKGDARAWYDALPCGSIQSPQDMATSSVDKYFPAHMQHAALQRIYNFKQLQDEHLPKAWGRFCSLLKARPGHEIPKNELLDIFYAYLTNESRSYLDSCAGCVFRQRTPNDAE